MKKKLDSVRIAEVLFFILLILPAVLSIFQVSTITDMEQENSYWGIARSLLGQKGGQLYNRSNVSSLGYSLVLAPICVAIKSPFAAYKAAVLMNGGILGLTFIIALQIVKRVYPDVKEGLLALGCFLAFAGVSYGLPEIKTGPEVIVLFLFWIGMFLLSCMYKKYRTVQLGGLFVVLMLMALFDAASLGIIIGIAVGTGFLTAKKKQDLTAFWRFILLLLIGIVAENYLQGLISKSLGYEPYFFAYPTGMLNGLLKSQYKVFANAIISRLLVVGVFSFLLGAAGIVALVKSCLKEKKLIGLSSIVLLCVLLQILMLACYQNGVEPQMQRKVFAGMTPVISFLAIWGSVALDIYTERKKTLAYSIIGLTVVGIIWMFQTNNFLLIGESAMELIKDSTNPERFFCLLALIFVFVISLLELVKKFKEKDFLTGLCNIMLLYLMADIFIVIGNAMTADNSILQNRQNMERIAPIASLLQNCSTDQEIYYLPDTAYNMSTARLQTLLPGREIQMVDEVDMQEFLTKIWGPGKETAILLTGTSEPLRWEIQNNLLPEALLIYMTDDLAVWTGRSNPALESLEAFTYDQLLNISVNPIETKTVEKTEEDEDGSLTVVGTEYKYTYGGNLNLVQGLYRLEVYLSAKDPSAFEGSLQVVDDSGSLGKCSITSANFDEAGKGSVGIDFTGKNVMTGVHVILENRNGTDMKLEKMFCRRLSSAYRLSNQNGSRLNDVCKKINKMDEQGDMIGSVAYLDDTISEAREVDLLRLTERLGDNECYAVPAANVDTVLSDYVIARNEKHAYFDLMDRYSVVLRGKSYTLLVRNDSAIKTAYEEEGETLLSDGKQIKIKAYGKLGEQNKMSLERGTYLYHFSLDREGKDVRSEETIQVCILLEDGTVAGKGNLSIPEPKEKEQEAVYSIPFSLRNKSDEIIVEVVSESNTKYSVVPESVELLYADYQYGIEAEGMQELLAEIYGIIPEAEFKCLVSKDTLKNKVFDCAYIQQLLPNYEVEMELYENALQTKEDWLVLTYGFTSNSVRLAAGYTLIGHAGKYTLWARSDGALLQKAISGGMHPLSVGAKISVDSIMKMTGADPETADGIISELPTGTYLIYVELDLTNIERADNVEVFFRSEKYEEEIQEEIASLMELGYTEEAAEEEVDTINVVLRQTLKVDQYQYAGNIIQQFGLSGVKKQNLNVEARSWTNKEVPAKILWVEPA